MALIIPHDKKTWPEDVVSVIEAHRSVINAWEREVDPYYDDRNIAQEYDRMIYAIADALCQHSLLGYHCSRLTNDEVGEISKNGLTLQNQETLCERIDKQNLSSDITKKLKGKNQADDLHRAKMIWFCFYPPYKAGQIGIERFFRSWGGEALYNSHENDPKTWAALLVIGTPRIIIAKVPIASTRGAESLAMMMAGREPIDFEDYSIEPILSENIERIISLPEQQFFDLTHADTWQEALT